MLSPPLAGPGAPVRERSVGLSSEEARARLAEVGPNVLAEAERPHWLARFGRNLTYFFALLLWAGAGLAWLGGASRGLATRRSEKCGLGAGRRIEPLSRRSPVPAPSATTRARSCAQA
jgi:Cation transporter/ATPase, N-terminus